MFAVGGTAPATAAGRVDVAEPTFSHPTAITNPLFPKAPLKQVLQLGTEGEDQVRFEVTQLRKTKRIAWNGRRVETLVTHVVAYTDGRISEVARDFYAQADDGSVWYFGEEVDNYEDGVIDNHDGSWLAGRDGPPGMIMPATPQVGDVLRPENIPGLVFEEVTVNATGLTVPGPSGPVSGAIATEAVLDDGTVENKISFAPEYGEFQAAVASKDELYSVALAVPVDALPGPVPSQLRQLSAGAADVFWTAPLRRWDRLAATIEEMQEAWDSFSGDPPPLLADMIDETLEALDVALTLEDVGGLRQAAIDAGMASLDLQERYRSVKDIDAARLALWRNQLLLDTPTLDHGLIAGDVATLRPSQRGSTADEIGHRTRVAAGLTAPGRRQRATRAGDASTPAVATDSSHLSPVTVLVRATAPPVAASLAASARCSPVVVAVSSLRWGLGSVGLLTTARSR